MLALVCAIVIGFQAQLAPPGAAAQAGAVPFEKLGRALLDASDAAGTAEYKSAPASPEAAILRRIQPLHARLRLGGIEIWIPTRTIGSDLRAGDGMSARAARPIAEALVALERRWVELADLDGGDARACAAAFDALAAWTKTLRDEAPAPQDATETAAVERALSWFADPAGRSGTRSKREFPIVLILAPTRAHYLAVLGAAGLTQPAYKDLLWSAQAPKSQATPLFHSAMLLSMANPPVRDGGSPYESRSLAQADSIQNAVHLSSHMLTQIVVPVVPDWFAEGLALADTIQIAGVDETICSGYRETVDMPGRSPVPIPGVGPAGSFVWVTRELSPYRGGSSEHWFLRELAAAHDERGFQILDLATGVVALTESGPFLGAQAVLPEVVAKAPDGLKKGFAEFFRAYCAAFVRFLEGEKPAANNLLELALVRLKKRTPRSGGAPPEDLTQVLFDLTAKTLGGRGGQEQDLEAAFVAWLEKAR